MSTHNASSAPPISLAVIVLGRARPGFDQEWSAQIMQRCGAHLRARYGTEVPPPVTQPTQLGDLLATPQIRQADLLLFLQPSIADGILADAIVQHAADKPLLFWATPERPEGNIVSSNSLVGTHLFVATLVQYGCRPAFVSGDPDSPAVQQRLEQEIRLLTAVAATKRARIGLIGAPAPGFVDLHVDPRHLVRCVGASVEHMTMHHFFEQLATLRTDQIDEYRQRLEEQALPLRDIATGTETRDMLDRQARYWAAYSALMNERGWQALALRCWPDLPQKYGHWPYVAVSMLLHERRAVAIEGDVDAAIATYAAYYLTDSPVYLSDWLAHSGDEVVLWHGGAIDPTLCVADPHSDYRAHITRHFNSQTPAVIEGDIAADTDVTVWRLWQSRGCYYASALTGRTAVPRQHFRGTTALIKCTADAGQWLERNLRAGMPHHLLMTVGHIPDILERYAHHMGWEWIT